MKIAAVIILYKPQDSLEFINKNLLTYSEYFNKIYLIDNSPEITSSFVHLEKIFYFHNKNKGGIAGAQNIGCSKALEDGFEWCMTLDQDSYFLPETLEKYFKLWIENISPENVSFNIRIKPPRKIRLPLNKLIRYKILSPIKRKLLNIKDLPPAGSDVEELPVSYPKKVIASGNIINLKVWKEVGKFDEVLFIDEVDNDFCFRLIRKGYRILRFNNLKMIHQIGDYQFQLIRKKYSYHSSFRLYYIFRNHYVIMKRYPEYKKEYRKELHGYLVDNILKSIHPIKNFMIFLKARKDAKAIN